LENGDRLAEANETVVVNLRQATIEFISEFAVHQELRPRHHPERRMIATAEKPSEAVWPRASLIGPLSA